MDTKSSIREHIEAYKIRKLEESIKQQVLEHAQTHGVKILDYKNVEDFTAAGNRVQLETFYSKLRASKLLEADDQPVEETPATTNVEDTIKVEVDGETVVDTANEESTDGVSGVTEAGTIGEEPPVTAADIGITDMLNALIKDEIEAIDGYNSAIATFRSEIDTDSEISEADKAKIYKAIAVLADISAEEHLHIGQLQEAQKLFNSQVNLIAKGEQEAQEQLANIPEAIPEE